ncbi:winged helix-turn-helix domain-containing protein [Streptomyces acidiscabies]|uniref:winged helix-turn-helix domain-containing protein n=1 Tax=Streptomyces acidiscabies TaxID=42234 RepID=UPI0009639F56|nr:winged helix-turn-helix domain-containing protein [Streptomyces acidiscabies]GAV42250.1 putative HTH-type transcriptional [Streptomyces acidiscabies]
MTEAIAECGNLPAAYTSFVGRRQETAEVRRLLDTRRLLTLTGTGGVGKTRLALEVATASAHAFADGVWLVNLAPVSDPSAVPAAVAGALRVPDLGARSFTDQLTGYLAGRHALLVLDTCEHLVDACADLVATLLPAAPELRVLATSRHTLGVTGEHVHALAPLAPDEAAELLRDRAAAVRPHSPDETTGDDGIARLCAGLDCLPLAIELAASRLRTLSVGQLTDRLEDRFALLTGGSRTAPAHQRTLRGMIDWSYELCAPAERLLWNRLSVFAGGFSLEAAEGVCSGDGIDEAEVLDLLDRLVTQSVVLTCTLGGRPRYRLLETIREYGRERLADSGELRRRHRDFFLALAQRIDRNWYGPGQEENLALLRAEHTNLLAALDHDGEPRTRLALVAALCWHWCAGGFLSEGRRQAERVLAAAPEPCAERARALLVAVWVAQTQGDLTAADHWLDEADALGRRLGDEWVCVQADGLRGVSAHYRGQPRESIRRYETALAAMTALGDERQVTSWRLALACVQAYADDPRAAHTGAQFIAAARTDGERWGRAQVLMALGHHAWARGDRAATGNLITSALETMRGLADHAMVARMLELLAWATAAGGAHERAARLLGLADALWRDAGSSVHAFGPRMAEQHARCGRAAIEALGEAAYRKAFAEGGRHQCPVQAVDYALAVPAPDEPLKHMSPKGPRTADVLLVDHDPAAREHARLALEERGHQVRTAADGVTGLMLFRRQTPDVAVLAARLPGLDGTGLALRIREESGVPVLLLSDGDDPADLETAADDRLARPVDGPVLATRVGALLRRSGAGQPSGIRAVRFGDLVFCPVSLEVHREGKAVHLTTTELKLLREFAASPGTVLTRDLLLERVWDLAWCGDNRVVDVNVQRLRAKIGRDRIETVRGFGYKLRP